MNIEQVKTDVNVRVQVAGVMTNLIATAQYSLSIDAFTVTDLIMRTDIVDFHVKSLMLNEAIENSVIEQVENHLIANKIEKEIRK